MITLTRSCWFEAAGVPVDCYNVKQHYGRRFCWNTSTGSGESSRLIGKWKQGPTRSSCIMYRIPATVVSRQMLRFRPDLIYLISATCILFKESRSPVCYSVLLMGRWVRWSQAGPTLAVPRAPGELPMVCAHVAQRTRFAGGFCYVWNPLRVSIGNELGQLTAINT